MYLLEVIIILTVKISKNHTIRLIAKGKIKYL